MKQSLNRSKGPLLASGIDAVDAFVLRVTQSANPEDWDNLDATTSLYPRLPLLGKQNEDLSDRCSNVGNSAASDYSDSTSVSTLWLKKSLRTSPH